MLFLYHDVKTNKNYLHPLEIYSFYLSTYSVIFYNIWN